MTEHKFAYKWNLSDGYPAPGIEKHGLKVFGTFICAGGSTMGYIIGMSVPPVMTAQIAHQIYLQWFKTAKKQP